jgi:serine/threonine protein kinase
MEWCNSRTLKEELEEDAISDNRGELCVLYLLSILYGLTACHERDLIHRDIKPENILVTHDVLRKKLKIADFGVCTFSSQPKDFEGTNFYQSP